MNKKALNHHSFDVFPVDKHLQNGVTSLNAVPG